MTWMTPFVAFTFGATMWAEPPLVVVIVPLCATFRDWPRAVSTHFVPPVLRGRTLFEKRRPSVT